ncbi:hypothetical protein JG688_00016719 [Phytophthora aleatoria]|uniref:Uncharacterized protein n=1 Tax=Phytophthora aleatoria TaxID=2496075 RepID=A0A8J5IBU6_9STRA|nr:hypothetical protein JG688_00016719 [Phytophthora aleatoria]
MKATGIPPHLAVVKKVSELQEPLAAIRSEMENLKTIMANSIPNEVASKHFVVNSVVPVSLRDIDMRIDKLRADLSSEFRQTIASGQNSIKRAPSGSTTEEKNDINPQHHMRHSHVRLVMEFILEVVFGKEWKPS